MSIRDISHKLVDSCLQQFRASAIELLEKEFKQLNIKLDPKTLVDKIVIDSDISSKSLNTTESKVTKPTVQEGTGCKYIHKTKTTTKAKGDRCCAKVACPDETGAITLCTRHKIKDETAPKEKTETKAPVKKTKKGPNLAIPSEGTKPESSIGELLQQKELEDLVKSINEENPSTPTFDEE